MLTFRAGAAGAASAAKDMAQHLRQSTLPADMAEMARYYQRGMAPDFAGDLGTDTFAQEAARLLAAGTSLDDLADALAAAVRSRHKLRGDGTNEAEALARLGELIAISAEPGTAQAAAAQDLTRGLEDTIAELSGRLHQAAEHGMPDKIVDAADWRRGLADAEAERDRMTAALGKAAAHAHYRYEKVLDTAETGVAGHTAAEPRRDMHPRLAELLGIDVNRCPTEGEIANLLQGQRADGADVPGKTRQASTDKRQRIGYVDLTFSADKSLSVAWAFAPTQAERNMLAQAHRDAVASAMEYIASQMGQVTKGHAGRDGFEPGHMGWIAFDHYTARPTAEVARVDEQGQGWTQLVPMGGVGAADPQLHTHVAVPNVVWTETGRVGSFDLQELAGRVHEYGAFYQERVATNLRKHGVEVALDEKTGAARLTAVPDHVRSAFSKRTADGTEAARDRARDLGLEWDKLAAEQKVELVKAGTQGQKLSKDSGLTAEQRREYAGAKRKDGLADFSAWGRQAEALRYRHKSVLHRSDWVARSRDERLEHAYQTALPMLEKMWTNRAKIDGQELRTIAARSLIASGAEGPKDIGAITRAFATRGVRQDGRDTSIVWGEDAPVRGKPRVAVTTALHEHEERDLVRLARAGMADRSSALPRSAIDAAVARRERMAVADGGLRFEGEHGAKQLDVMHALGEGGRFSMAIGVAGAGKSALLRPLVDAWRSEGRAVYGVALAWRQANDLDGAGIDKLDRAAMSVFLSRAAEGRYALDRTSVVVVDEIGLIGTRQLLDVLRLQEKHGFQIVAVGDNRQSQSIEAGPVISILREALGEDAVPEILTTLRQRTDRERETSLLFREGDAAQALERKRQDGTVEVVPGGHREVVQRVAALWRERVEANKDDTGFSITVSAPTNSDARAIAEAIREQRREMGQVGPDIMRVDVQDGQGVASEMKLAPGDRVRLFAHTRASFGNGRAGNIGSNGSVLEVVTAGAGGVTMRNALGNEGVVRWETLRDKATGRIRLAYGDVLSVDAVQGVTSTEHINAMPSGSKWLTSFKNYVAESRHRSTTWMVLSDGAERREIAGRRPLGDVRAIRQQDVYDNIARNLSREPEKGSAMAFLARARGLRRGTVTNLQAGLQQGEQRTVEGKAMSTMPQTAEGKTREAAAKRVTVRRTVVVAQRWRKTRDVMHRAVADAVERIKPAVQQVVDRARRMRSDQAEREQRARRRR